MAGYPAPVKTESNVLADPVVPESTNVVPRNSPPPLSAVTAPTRLLPSPSRMCGSKSSAPPAQEPLHPRRVRLIDDEIVTGSAPENVPDGNSGTTNSFSCAAEPGPKMIDVPLVDGAVVGKDTDGSLSGSIPVHVMVVASTCGQAREKAIPMNSRVLNLLMFGCARLIC